MPNDPQRLSPSGRETLRIIDVLAVDFASVPAQTAPDQLIAVPGVKPGDYIYATPFGVWPNGLTMLPHRCTVEGSAIVRLANVTLAPVNPVAQTVRFSCFRPLPTPRTTGIDRHSPSGAIQKVTVDLLPGPFTVFAHAATDQAIAVPGAKIGDTIIVTPQGFFPPNILLGGPHRCLADGIVQVRFANTSDFTIDIEDQPYRFTLFRIITPTRQSPSGREERRDVTVTFDSAVIPAETALDQTVSVLTAKPGDSIIATPNGVFNADLAMGPHRVFENDSLIMRIGNPSAAPIDPGVQSYTFALFRGPGIPAGPPPTPPSPPAVPLLTAANYVGIGKTGITNVPTSVITGDLAVSPAAAASITGFALVLDGGGTFSTSAQVTGQVFAADYAPPTPATLTQAVTDMEAAYTFAAGMAPDFVEFNAGLLSGVTLVPGVYKWSTNVTVVTDITLQGGPGDVFVFEIAGVLTVAPAMSVLLSGGVLPENIFWQVAGNTAIGTTAHMEGVILCLTDITLDTGATMNGKCLAQTAVNYDSNIVIDVP